MLANENCFTLIDNEQPSTSQQTINCNDRTIVYPLNKIISSLMFSYGDGYQPHESCQELMLNLVNEQLKNLIQKAKNVAKFRSKDSIGYCEMFFNFRKHTIFIKRLIQYLKISESISIIIQTDNDTYDEDIDGELVEKNRKLKQIIDALKAIEGDNEFAHIFYSLNSSVDEVKLERMRRMVQRGENFDISTYEKFADARKISFCSKNGRKNQTFINCFKGWLEEPELENEIAYILNFCAIEIVAVLVENATVCREQEAPNQFDDKYPQNSLQLRHYHEALRRNYGYVKRRDFLFGYF